MEAKVAQVIHNSAGQVSMQRAAVADLSAQLTAELTGWQAKCKEQKEEIEGLKQLVRSHMMGVYAYCRLTRVSYFLLEVLLCIPSFPLLFTPICCFRNMVKRWAL